jgi:hypothetical protein
MDYRLSSASFSSNQTVRYQTDSRGRRSVLHQLEHDELFGDTHAGGDVVSDLAEDAKLFVSKRVRKR